VAIVGGQRKDVSLAECAIPLARYCRVVIGMGESGPDFAEAVGQHGASCQPVKIHVVAALPDAVRLARTEAKPGEVILFSPAAPSFDQYANFTERGRHFVELVKNL
jgi:UDP-N-acetylmuramoylalanine--D-glutamate ligase